MSNTIKGTIKEIGEEVRFESGFYKRTVLVDTGGEWPQVLPVDFVKENTKKVEGLQPGTAVTVSIDIRSHKTDRGRYFVDLVGWKVEEL
jgi:single-strand DNA-binding protein